MTTKEDLNQTRDARTKATLDLRDTASSEPIQSKANLFSTHAADQSLTIDRLFSTYDGLFSHA